MFRNNTNQGEGVRPPPLCFKKENAKTSHLLGVGWASPLGPVGSLKQSQDSMKMLKFSASRASLPPSPKPALGPMGAKSTLVLCTPANGNSSLWLLSTWRWTLNDNEWCPPENLCHLLFYGMCYEQVSSTIAMYGTCMSAFITSDLQIMAHQFDLQNQPHSMHLITVDLWGEITLTVWILYRINK